AIGQATQPSKIVSEAAGELIRIEGQNLVIQSMWKSTDGEPVVVVTDAETRFLLDVKPSSLEQLTEGMDLTALQFSRKDDKPVLEVVAWSPSNTGMITKIDGNQIHLSRTHSGREPVELIVTFNEETIITRLPSYRDGEWHPISVTGDDLRENMLVKAMPPKGIAQRLFIWKPRQNEAASTQKADGLD
ncbi:MAG TPA: hypothetical protein PK402_12325, partial [Tepidisphaeraceae bacterium]|nr:hypothetical protein [Tepidisphaeraceae bacterium]